MNSRILAGMCAVLAAWTAPASAQQKPQAHTGPSFNCTAAMTRVEQAICDDPALSAADSEMAALFAVSRVSAFGTGPSNQLAAQREAVRDMRKCADAQGPERLKQCIAAAYANRTSQLAVATLLTAPDQALPALKRLDPPFAPIGEAVALWAGEPIDADWAAPARTTKRARIAALLKPYLTELQTNQDQSFGRSILSDPAPDGIAVRTIDELFTSDRHFAAFLNILGPYLPESGTQAQSVSGRRALPCAAIVRHPALLRATDAVFGSTMDNFVIDNDCETSLPPTPALTALNSKLWSKWPDCDGTIRFAAYRSYQTTLDKARLGQVKHDPKATTPTYPGVTAADIAAARTELAQYYATYLGKAPASAAAMARDALAEILSHAHQCE